MSAAKPMGVCRRLVTYLGEANVYTGKLTPAQRRRLAKKARKSGEAVSGGE